MGAILHPPILPHNDLTVGDWSQGTACPSRAMLCSSSKPPRPRCLHFRIDLLLVRDRGCERSQGCQQRCGRTNYETRCCCKGWNEISIGPWLDLWVGAVRIQEYT